MHAQIHHGAAQALWPQFISHARGHSVGRIDKRFGNVERFTLGLQILDCEAPDFERLGIPALAEIAHHAGIDRCSNAERLEG